ncbi:MAG: FAD-binding domain-containing protein [Neisseria sp.]|nr:FAD-binding domain-containing protein [Neisseria sp.]
MDKIGLLYFHKDLRCQHNAALAAASHSDLPLAAVYFLPAEHGLNFKQYTFLQQSLQDLQHNLLKLHIPLHVLPYSVHELPKLAQQWRVAEIFSNQNNDLNESLQRQLTEHGCRLHLFPEYAVLPQASQIASESTFSQAWLAALPSAEHLLKQEFKITIKTNNLTVLPEIWQRATPINAPNHSVIHGGETAAQKQLIDLQKRLSEYEHQQPFPARQAEARLSPYLRFGCIAWQQLLAVASENRFLLNLCCKRDFYRQLMPKITPTTTTLSATESEILQRWQQGKTGYPLIDAAMRCLTQTGLLHADLRAAAAQFLCHFAPNACDLGAHYFAEHLLDFDEKLNQINWQKAQHQSFVAPNMLAQRCDPDGRFTRRFLPELAHLNVQYLHTPWLAAHHIETHDYPSPLPLP